MKGAILLVMALSSLACAPMVGSTVISSAAEADLVSILRSAEAIPIDRAGGIGVVLDENAAITEVIGGGPADLAHIQVGDRVVRIAGRTVVGYDDARELLGRPGTEVLITIRSNGVETEHTLTRMAWWSILEAISPSDGREQRPGF